MSASDACCFTPHHVGIIVADLESAMNADIANFGYTFHQFEVNESNASLGGSGSTFSLRFGFGQLGLSVVKLIQPVSGTTLYSRRLTQVGPGFHHLGFSVADLAAARRQLEMCGDGCLQNGSIHGLVDFNYYDATDLGCIVEPLQPSSDLISFLIQNAQPYAGKST